MKPRKVIFADDELEKVFYSLSDKDPIKEAIIRAIKNLEEDTFCGRDVKKKLIQKMFVEKFGIDNL